MQDMEVAGDVLGLGRFIVPDINSVILGKAWRGGKDRFWKGRTLVASDSVSCIERWKDMTKLGLVNLMVVLPSTQPHRVLKHS